MQLRLLAHRADETGCRPGRKCAVVAIVRHYGNHRQRLQPKSARTTQHYSRTESRGKSQELRVRSDIIRNASIQIVGKFQSRMFSKLRILCERIVAIGTGVFASTSTARPSVGAVTATPGFPKASLNATE